MAQIVGQPCTVCRKVIGWVGDSRFCEICERPVHNDCMKTGEAASDGCSGCGATTISIAPRANTADEISLNPSGSPAEPTVPSSHVRLRWWQFGLFGGIVLSLATAVKVIRVVVRGAADNAEWSEIAGFAAAVFGMGFVCGLIVWAGRGLHRQLGRIGDAILGVAVMSTFFVACMLLFEPAMLGEKFANGGAPMLGLAVLLGAFAGAKFGPEWRKAASNPYE